MEGERLTYGRKRDRLRRWELALLLAAAVSALWGTRLDAEQAALADRVVRLHVLANSDDPADQALKREVRDAVLSAADGLVPPEADREQAEALMGAALPELAAAGAEVVAREGFSYPVTASLEHDVWFPTKTYQDFALPAGTYTALRIEIGEGDGQNWWCVVFPPLCLGSVTECSGSAGLSDVLSEREVALVTGESEGYVVKFKAMELLEEARRWWEARA
ncbi:stage II sporulation protein R [Pseudoflavonifractor sp. MSJ-37]|uniref:stage II sporulation protein R n=1 Tax=Pseudoflavonifractor sp. MSJ-37 TaxID=2841531 RepID=UPI001C10EDDB|nr:stage II sporulation protein R [Pseudoflavonifractor sp. MSJ-37]MBU5435184.1 stage II sporulation protein R [Pseudoflavonifractor sp. MSJ-37]